MKDIYRLLPLLLILSLMVGCSSTYYNEIRLLDVLDNASSKVVYERLYDASKSSEGIATFEIDSGSGIGYLLVTTGEDNKLRHHLRLTGVLYDKHSRLLTVRIMRYVPKMAPQQSINDKDWQLVLRFRKFSFEKLRVIVDVEGATDSSEQKLYELAVDEVK